MLWPIRVHISKISFCSAFTAFRGGEREEIVMYCVELLGILVWMPTCCCLIFSCCCFWISGHYRSGDMTFVFSGTEETWPFGSYVSG